MTGVASEQAERTRAAVVAAAQECFLARGYAATTMKDIAGLAGVSPQAAYTVGGKAALLVTVADQALAGDPARLRALRDERERDKKLRLLRDVTREWLPMAHAMTRLFREASAGDPGLVEAWDAYESRRLAGVRTLVRSFGHLLRPDVSVERAADACWALFGGQTADALMLGRGWSADEYVDWLADAVDRLLLRRGRGDTV
ncbi:TetR/AcrR family transcriptional regulator [Nonomuraea maritima]|uniref:TetR/AcrR family transcriptional regulator n=1 Tax=Nonomuraea maritima TaxID=683260 RepID=UPI0037102B54